MVRTSAASDPIAHKAGDPNYLNQFFARSRLHYLSMWKVEAKEQVERLQEQSDGTFPGRQRLRRHLGQSVTDPLYSANHNDHLVD